ncbi:MAG: SpoIIE family protein phosphatase [Bryobacterales bacterium]|nr:SpoIIE family protein phosphatase [Bryobacterales bacterium]
MSDSAAVLPLLLDRREKLQAAARSIADPSLHDLLSQVDAALNRIQSGAYGLCESCHEPIEPDRLRADPLARFCLDHLDAKERSAHERDLQLATQIQSKLLPPASLIVSDWETHYSYQAAGPVGGDYCELIPDEDGQSLFFALGDVAGKGVAASLLMTHLSAIFRSLLSVHLPLPELMSRANRLFCESTLSAHYATMVCGRASRGSLEISNAGHCPPLLVRNGRIERLDFPGLPLGMFCSMQYPVQHINLGAGESLILYSDGVTEAVDASATEFGEDRLLDFLLQSTPHSAAALAQAIVARVAHHRGPQPPTDDLTVLVLRHR